MTATLEIAEKLHTVQEWLESEKHSEVRHEYYYGKLITMAGEARKANTVSKNLVRLLDVPLYQRGYEAFFLDVKAEVVPGGIYRYPDMVVTPVTDNADDYIVKQAILLAEVASEDSGYRDRVKKRKEYLKIPSLHYYLVISQDEMMIEFQVKRPDGSWDIEYLTEPTDILDLKKFDLKIPLSDIYWRVKTLP